MFVQNGTAGCHDGRQRNGDKTNAEGALVPDLSVFCVKTDLPHIGHICHFQTVFIENIFSMIRSVGSREASRVAQNWWGWGSPLHQRYDQSLI